MTRRKVTERHPSPHHWTSPQGQHAWVSVLFPRLGEAKDQSIHRSASTLHRAHKTKRSRHASLWGEERSRVPLEISIARSDTTGTSQESSPYEERPGTDKDLSFDESHSDLRSLEDDPYSRQCEPPSSFHLSLISFPNLPVTPANGEEEEPTSIPEDECLFHQSLTTHDTVWDMTITTLEEEDSYDLNVLPPLYTYHA